MTYNPLISVVIPVFNRRVALREAVDSVLAQTYSHIELIIVDDGSEDGTKVEFVKRHDLRFLHLEKISDKASEVRSAAIPKSPGARGVSAARNAGIRAARGEWIALLDSDDLWKPEKIEKQIHYFENNPDMLICQTEEIWIRNGRRVNPKQIHKKHGGNIFEECLPRCIISPSAVMFRKSLLDEVGYFDESFPVCEDYELWLRVCAKYPVGLIPEALTIKRGGHADQLSNQHSLDYFRILALVKLLDSSRIDPKQRTCVLGELKRKYEVYVKGCLKRRNTHAVQEMQNLTQQIRTLEIYKEYDAGERASLASK